MNSIIKILGIRKKRIVYDEILINDLVVLCSNNIHDFSLIAYFSCYKKSIDIICKVLSSLWFDLDIKYLYYGKEKFNYIDKIEYLPNWINILQEKCYIYFKKIFGEIFLNVSPNEFYYRYRKYKRN